MTDSEGPLVIDEVKVAVLALTDPAGKRFVRDKGLNKVYLGVGVLIEFCANKLEAVEVSR